MQANQNMVAGHGQVLLDIIGAHGIGHGVSGKCMLRQVAAGAAMGDDNLFRPDRVYAHTARNRKHNYAQESI